MYGLQDRDNKMIVTALKNNKEIECAKIFGSRAIGNYKKGSDIDIAIFGEKVTEETILHLNEVLNEIYPLPYFFDLLHYEATKNKNLKRHIDQVGIELYCSETN